LPVIAWTYKGTASHPLTDAASLVSVAEM
jgi:hypothetical protein